MDARGLHVVLMDDDGTYHVCLEALRGVVARTELHDLPVAVVSVAGATRSGKSFLLDFLLRYLQAAPSARADGSWLGADDEPLGGFSWRGGCELNTTGIMLWSEPIVLTRANGQKVVVLLMDTQGTFDSSSTIRHSTTVFAMSTLLSSVQIFNLSMNMQEDHLQYLQLFTEYGKLAMENDGTKPFQTLQFLIRDWCYSYQYPIGAIGGQQFMDTRLQISESQAAELKDVREHIRSSFESVRCFLMPHPGLTVATSPNFLGYLSDISTEFQKALLELVKGLFEKDLTLKKINGQEIKVQELVKYFESYMEVFNSDQLPNPVIILKATSSACLEAALSAARELYTRVMEGESETQSVPRDVMPRMHAGAKDAAREAFLARRTLAAPEQAAERLDRLSQELDHLFINYTALNEAKMQASKIDSKTAYEKHMDVVECLLLWEFKERHVEGIALALNLFDDSRLLQDETDIEGDEDRKDLQQELQQLNQYFELKNEAKINAGIASAMQEYEMGFSKTHPVSSICVSNEDLIILHRASETRALDMFDSYWMTPGNEQNEHRIVFLTHILKRFNKITIINTLNNEKAVEKALKIYDDAMHDILGTDSCLHPGDFENEHSTCKENAIADFYSSRTYGERYPSGSDDFELNIQQGLSKLYAKHKIVNIERNENAVKTAHEFYERCMCIRRDPGLRDLIQFFGPVGFDVVRRHREMVPRTISFYNNELRIQRQEHGIDEYSDQLRLKIKATFEWLLLKKLGASIAITIGSIAIPMLSIFRR